MLCMALLIGMSIAPFASANSGTSVETPNRTLVAPQGSDMKGTDNLNGDMKGSDMKKDADIKKDSDVSKDSAVKNDRVITPDTTNQRLPGNVIK